jgi:hypothetical protein
MKAESVRRCIYLSRFSRSAFFNLVPITHIVQRGQIGGGCLTSSVGVER